jgi:hypothetical protein
MSRSVRAPDYSLRVYPKHPAADAYRVGGSYTPYAIVGTAKRFSTAELLAQYWYGQAMGGNQNRAAQLWRFATQPSYDD